MPRIKKPLRSYPGGHTLAGYIGSTAYSLPTKDLADYLPLVRGAEKLLRRHDGVVQKLYAEVGEGMAHILLLGDAFNFASHPEMMTDPKSKGKQRIAALIAWNPEFALRYLLELRQLVSRKKAIVKAAAVLRTDKINDSYGKVVSVSDATDKDVAAAAGVTAETVKKARKLLAKVDEKMWGAGGNGKK